MKKILAAILAGAFGLTAVAQTAVYDYKLSFKRVDPVYKIRKIDGDPVLTDSYKVASDSINGYILVNLCDDCKGPVANSYAGDSAGVAFLTRKGDKLSKKYNMPFVLKTYTNGMDSAVFGSFDDTTGRPYNPKDQKLAWLAFDMGIPDTLEVVDASVVAKGAGDPIPYGFLGLDHTTGGTIWHVGFGTSTPGQKYVSCTAVAGDSCQILNSISGSIDSDYFGYFSVCGVPMWDLCDSTSPISFAPISGTWTMKFNKSLSNAGNYLAQEKAILKKLGVDVSTTATIAEDVIDFLYDEEGVTTGQWLGL